MIIIMVITGSFCLQVGEGCEEGGGQERLAIAPEDTGGQGSLGVHQRAAGEEPEK